MKIASFAWCVAAASCIQLPFAVDVARAPSRAHHSTLDASSHPIDLSQYDRQMVVRVKKSAQVVAYLKKNQISVWASDSTAGTVDIQVHQSELPTHLSELGLESPQVVISDMGQAIFETYPEEFQGQDCVDAPLVQSIKAGLSSAVSPQDKLHALGGAFFKRYRTQATIDSWLQLLKETYPALISLETIGETYEGRPYNIVHLSVPHDVVSPEDRRTIVVTGGVHAREWISVSSVLYTIYDILHHYENNPQDWVELSKLDFLFIPVSNPDGYNYTWTTDRLWRKNRQPSSEHPDSACKGIDIDHSYDFHWTPSSDSVCGEEYAGAHPFEAYESRIWDEYLNKTNEDHSVWGYLDLHSYSQEVLYPYAFSCHERPRDEENLIELAYGISKAIRMTSGKYYAALPACIDRDSDLIPDLGAGTALDYMYHHKSYWAYQLKLRDGGSHGFLLPPKYIEPVGREIAAGIKYFCKFILSDN